MIKLEDLKNNILLTTVFGYSFVPFVQKQSNNKCYYIDIFSSKEIFSLGEKSLNVLVLLNRISKNETLSMWNCFCDGKICMFNIFNSDLEILSIVE